MSKGIIYCNFGIKLKQMNKKLVSLVLSGLIVLSNIHCIENVYANEKNTNYNETSSKNSNTIIEIPDVALKNAIYKKLGLTNNSNITVSNLQAIEDLTINSEDTSNLEGIQYCKNLKELAIINCNVSDISLLSNLTNLETLKLDGNNIEHLYPLADLKKLKTLTLSSNDISSISVLANLTNLEVLDLHKNLISNISSLSGLKNLESIDLSNNKISDLRPLLDIKNKLDNNGKFDYQLIELDPVEIKDNQVIMKFPKIYDIDGSLLKEPSKFSGGSDYKIVEDTVIWNNVKEGSTLKIVFESKYTPFDVTISQKITKPQTNISITDIKGHWAEETINNFINKGYIHGYTDSTFKPDNSITRAEFIKIFNKYFGLTNTSGKSFTDTTNHWAKDEIDIAITNNIITGFEDKTFRPDEPITREQAALIISNYKKLPNNNLNYISKYNDSNSISSWSKNAVEAMLEKGYMSGYSDNTLKPKNNLTRAEAVSLLSRIQ